MSHRLLVKDRRGEREVVLVGTVTIGRDPRCEISDTDAQLSRRHAEICLSERGVVARDLDSRNGMLVNGRRILEAVLHPGDVLQVASLAVTFVSANSEAAAVSMPAVSPSGPLGAAASGPPLSETSMPEDDGTGVMSADQVAAAALASIGRAPFVDRRSEAVNFPVTADRARKSSPAAPGAERAADAAVTWTASITWQVGTLAAVSCLVGTASALPWRSDAAGHVPAGAMLLLPLVGLVVALGAGFLVAARMRRAALSAFGALAARVRAAADGEAERVSDPLGTKPTGELAEAINDILVRARRA